MFVYFIQAGSKKGPVKIGYANNVETRMAELQIGCPFTLSILFTIEARGLRHAQMMEAWFHDRWHRRRIRGEWFKSIKLNQITPCVPYAVYGKDWDEVRAEGGGDYETRGKARPLLEDEKTNQEQVDRLAHCVGR